MKQPIFGICALGAAILLHAEAGAAKVAVPKELGCDFRSQYVASGPEGGWRSPKTGDRLTLAVSAINLKKNTAQLVGDSGVLSLKVLQGERQISFLAMSLSGDISLTTVVLDIANAPRSLRAVHSRYSTAAEDIQVAQYAGFCEPKY